MKILVVILLAVLSLAVAEDEGHFYCGRRLAQTLGYLCSSEYALVKRGYPFQIGFQTRQLSWQAELEPWVTPAKAQRLHGGRGKRQVVDECCLKPCAIDELLAYC